MYTDKKQCLQIFQNEQHYNFPPPLILLYRLTVASSLKNRHSFSPIWYLHKYFRYTSICFHKLAGIECRWTPLTGGLFLPDQNYTCREKQTSLCLLHPTNRLSQVQHFQWVSPERKAEVCSRDWKPNIEVPLAKVKISFNNWDTSSYKDLVLRVQSEKCQIVLLL